MCPDDCLFLSSVSPATCAGFVGQEPACRAHHWCCQAPGASPKKPHERQGELATVVDLARQHPPHRSLCQTSHPRLRSSLPTCAKSDVGFTTVGFLQCLKIASDRFCKSRRPRVLCIGALARLPSRDLTVLSVVPE